MQREFDCGGISAERLKGTKTEVNLHTALSGESQAYLRYRWFEEKAKTDGLVEISRIFGETAENEKEHAEIWFKFLGGWSTTEKNLDTAAGGERFEWKTMYAEFAETARAEGFEYLAALFDKIASVEKMHEDRYRDYWNRLKQGEMFVSDDAQTKWICLNCGYVVCAKDAPPICPACQHDRGYFKKQA